MALVSRQALYELVWAKPMRTLAQEFNLSDTGLKKICQRVEIPVPDRGYWTKLRASKAVKPANLPPRGPGMPDAVYIGEYSRFGSHIVDPEVELAEPIPVEPQFNETLDHLRLRIAARVGKVIYERTLNAPHGLIRNLLADDEKRGVRARDLPWRLASAEPFFDSAFEKRRLRILSSLFTALQKFGCQPWIADPEARNIGVIVGMEHRGFVLDHPAAKANRRGQWRTRPGWADELRLTIAGEGARSWSDTEEQGLEVHLTDIVVSLVTVGELSYRAAARDAFTRSLQRRRQLEEELVRRRAETERKAREAEAAMEKARRSELLNMAMALRSADDIRSLVVRVIEKRGPNDAAAYRWAEWARSVADQLDPSEWPMIDPADLVRNDEQQAATDDATI